MSFLVDIYRQRLEEREWKTLMSECDHMQSVVVERVTQSES